MVSLDWRIINSTVTISDTKKKFYNKYLYCIKYFCPGGRIILGSPSKDIYAEVTRRLEFEMSYKYNYGGSWFRPSYKSVNKINVEQLVAFKNVKNTHGTSIKIRIEEPYVIIYSNDINCLYELASKDLNAWSVDLIKVVRPRNQETIKYLDKGCIITNTKSNFKYKFICKSGRCANKKAILNYLYNLGDTVAVSNSIWTLLENTNHDLVWSLYFYGNDPNIADFLNIIEPNFITNIHEVVSLEY